MSTPERLQYGSFRSFRSLPVLQFRKGSEAFDFWIPRRIWRTRTAESDRKMAL